MRRLPLVIGIPMNHIDGSNVDKGEWQDIRPLGIAMLSELIYKCNIEPDLNLLVKESWNLGSTV